MAESCQFALPEIKDADIGWATAHLGISDKAFLGENGDDPRLQALRCLDSLDIEACPGSGKTTLLVAKLAVLARQWPHRTRGVCVLSHTNAARSEIEVRLGNTDAGRKLLSYPHFVGTIHAFIATYLAIPWLRSQGYPIKMIDTDVSVDRRWNRLPYEQRAALEKNHHGPSILSIRSSDFTVGAIKWGKGLLGVDTKTYGTLCKSCKDSITDGYHSYDEIFVWARDLIEKAAHVVQALRGRFPLVLMDEAQDNSETQSAMLYRIFAEPGTSVVRQRFGDANQAIFDSMRDKAPDTDPFPSAAKLELPNSHRFDQQVADLAAPLGVRPYESGLKGEGPCRFRTTQLKDAPHTVFLFDTDGIARVLDAYGRLLVSTFPERVLQTGSFAAVGHIHRRREDANQKTPYSLHDYWAEYDSKLLGDAPRPDHLIQYISHGVRTASERGETFPAVEKLAQGVLRLASMGEGNLGTYHRRNCHRLLRRVLEASSETVSKLHLDLVAKVCIQCYVPERETWETEWAPNLLAISEAVADTKIDSTEAQRFLAWCDEGSSQGNPSAHRRDNVYRYLSDGTAVPIRLGSIHSVKGQTHTAILVVETRWHQHNLERLKPWLLGQRKGWKSSDGVRQKERLKLHYVALTRPTHLLCLAMKRDSFNDAELATLEKRGWRVCKL